MGKSWKDSHKDNRYHDYESGDYDRNFDHMKQKDKKESRILREMRKKLRDIEEQEM